MTAYTREVLRGIWQMNVYILSHLAGVPSKSECLYLWGWGCLSEERVLSQLNFTG